MVCGVFRESDAMNVAYRYLNDKVTMSFEELRRLRSSIEPHKTLG